MYMQRVYEDFGSKIITQATPYLVGQTPVRIRGLTPIDQQECKTYDFDGDETKTGSARMVVYVGAM
jgi:hypothetical protein